MQGKSEVCSKIAKTLHTRLQDLYANSILSQPKDVSNDQSADIENSGIAPSNPAYNLQRATLLIVERSVDYAGAFQHDLSYGSLLREIPNAEEQIEAAISKFKVQVVES